ncbi:MFS transporter [Motiliproteus sediminis]|uniref:MFS transporter n=1 Tax=Motiliproteus sediminis TaxID=1468178 RepID=UPI001AEFB79E|nr:MFS transporter [Motiliproteus sediminis]
MHHPQGDDTPARLLRSPRFGPFFVTLFLGTFNDNLFKNTLILMVVYQAATQQGGNVNQLTNLAAALFILPYLLFSAIAGQLADRWEKSRLIRSLKLVEVALMLLTAQALLSHNLTLLMVLLFLMATQSAVFSPIKFSLIPQHLERWQWVSGNGLVEAGTFAAILLGTLIAGLIYPHAWGMALVSALIVIQALAGWLAARHIPPAPSIAPELQPDWNPLRASIRLIGNYWSSPRLRLLILFNAWFWFVGASYLTQIPNFARSVLGGNATCVSWLLACLTIGIGLGSLGCSRLKRDRYGREMPCLGLALMVLAGLDLVWASPALQLAAGDGMIELLRQLSGWRISVDLVLIGVAGGLFIVPLCTQFQAWTDGRDRARVFAVSNIFNALFMVVSALAGFVLLGNANWSIPQFFLLIALLNLAALALLVRFRPHWAAASLLRLWPAGKR